jgi:hypothetical protein
MILTVPTMHEMKSSYCILNAKSLLCIKWHVNTDPHWQKGYIISGWQTFVKLTKLCWLKLAMNNGSQTFDEDWWTMLIEPGTEWTLNQSYEFKVMNSLSTPRPKTKDEHYWSFIPCINIKEDEDTYAFIRILVQYGAKFKWEIRRMGWYWFPSLNVYRITPVFFPLVVNHFSVERKVFSKVCDPLINPQLVLSIFSFW